MNQPSAANAWMREHVERLEFSYYRLTGRQLYNGEETGADRAMAIFHAKFALLSHGLEADPLFNYANQCALNLFELDWQSLVQTPSRKSAEAAGQQAREQFMASVIAQGYVDNYSGVRVSSSGKRFTIKHATVWNVLDPDGAFHGQAACFARWTMLTP